MKKYFENFKYQEELSNGIVRGVLCQKLFSKLGKIYFYSSWNREATLKMVLREEREYQYFY